MNNKLLSSLVARADAGDRYLADKMKYCHDFDEVVQPMSAADRAKLSDVRKLAGPPLTDEGVRCAIMLLIEQEMWRDLRLVWHCLDRDLTKFNFQLP